MDSLGDGLIATIVFNCCAALVGYRAFDSAISLDVARSLWRDLKAEH